MKLHLKQLFTKLVTAQITYDQVEWEKEPLEFIPLLDILETFNDNFTDTTWIELRDRITEQRYLPWARKHYLDKKWKTRNLVSQIFLLNPKEEDLPMMEYLLNDKAYSIRMIITEAIGNMQLTCTIPLLLQKMSQEVDTARFIYRHTLLKMPHEFFPVLLQTFEQTPDDAIKICCLDIMSHQYYGNIHPFLKKHLSSENETIRAMIAKILHMIQTSDARDDLVILLDDSSPRVRVAATEALGDITDKSSFEKISQMLYDPDYDVRVQAALALLKYGQEGVRFLELQDADLVPKAHEVARYVLTLP